MNYELPDGSSVQVMENSRLTYNHITWLWERKLQLLGKASFNVKMCIRDSFHTAFYIREAHFEQCSDQTTGRDIVSCKNQSFVIYSQVILR